MTKRSCSVWEPGDVWKSPKIVFECFYVSQNSRSLLQRTHVRACVGEVRLLRVLLWLSRTQRASVEEIQTSGSRRQ